MRNISTTATNHAYIEILADISLASYPIFAQFPEKHFNINGSGHKITDINTVGNDYNAGLFIGLHTDDYVKDLTIEGKVSGGGAVGGLASRLTLRNSAVLSNIDVYMLITAKSTSSLTVGGIAGVLEGMTAGSKAISECAFKGTIETSSTSTSTTNMSIGGIMGQLWNGGGANDFTFMVQKCLADAVYKINNRQNLHLGGILGEA